MANWKYAVAWGGYAGAVWSTGQVIESRAFMQAAEKMNAQIGDDIGYLT